MIKLIIRPEQSKVVVENKMFLISSLTQLCWVTYLAVYTEGKVHILDMIDEYRAKDAYELPGCLESPYSYVTWERVAKEVQSNFVFID